MRSNLHMWGVLIALIILHSHFQFYVISLSFSSGILTANSTTGKDPISQQSSFSGLPRLSIGGYSTPSTPKSTSFQSLATSFPPTITSNSHIAPSTTPFFIVPTVTSTISIHLDINVAQSSTSSGPGVFVTNPNDPKQVVPFEARKIPINQRATLPDVMTDTAPAALEIDGIVGILFTGYIVVIPAVKLPSWLSL